MYITTFFLQDYYKELWNPSKTKIPITIGKGTDADKPISEAPHAGQLRHITEYNVGCVMICAILVTITDHWTFN